MTRAAYAETPPGSTVTPLEKTGPYAMGGVGVIERSEEAPGCDYEDGERKTVDDITRCIGYEKPDVILVYTSIEKRGVVLDDREPGWSRVVVDRLVASGSYGIRYQNGFNAVLLRTAPTVVGPDASRVGPGGN